MVVLTGNVLLKGSMGLVNCHVKIEACPRCWYVQDPGDGCLAVIKLCIHTTWDDGTEVILFRL